MKLLAILLVGMVMTAGACQHDRTFAGWVIQPDSTTTRYGLVEGKMQQWGRTVAYANFVCPDSLLQAKKDSAQGKAKVGK